MSLALALHVFGSTSAFSSALGFFFGAATLMRNESWLMVGQV